MKGPSSIVGLVSSVWPVVQRELRARARKRRYYWMRVLTGLGAMVIVNRLLALNMPQSEISERIFIYLGLLLVVLISIAVPAMTSDCISKEKRDGTLGLLFLTPLTPAGIVIGKCLTQALLAWSLWLSVLPALAVPFLLGGITASNLVTTAVFQFCALVCSLAAGILASCWTQERNTALCYAAVLTSVFLSLLSLLIFAITFISTQSFPSPWNAIGNSVLEICNQGLLSVVFGISAALEIQIGRMPPRFPLGSMWILTSSLALAILTGSIWLAARHICNTWYDKPSSVRQQSRLRRFCTPLFPKTLRWKMQRSLDKNPIAWLQEHSWKARIFKWGLCLALLLVLSVAMVSNNFNFAGLNDLEMCLSYICMVIGTIAAVGSFRSEKESGALELILVTPLTANAIIIGRAVGWWKQFLPAGLLLLFFYCATDSSFHVQYNNEPDTSLLKSLCYFGIVFLTLPFFAVYTALRVKYLIGALGLTWFGIFLEFGFGRSMAAAVTLMDGDGSRFTLLFTFLSSAAFVGLTFFLLRHSLSRRIYSF